MDHFEFMELLRDLYDKYAVNHYEKVFPPPPKTSVRVEIQHAIRTISVWNHNPFLGTKGMITDCNAMGLEPMISPLYYNWNHE